MSEFNVIEGASCVIEIGAITELAAHLEEHPAVLFDSIKDFPKGYRILTNFISNRTRERLISSHLVAAAFTCLIVVGLLLFISAARDISTVVLLATGPTRTLSLLMLDYTAGAELERATVVAAMIVVLVVVAALTACFLRG